MALPAGLQTVTVDAGPVFSPGGVPVAGGRIVLSPEWPLVHEPSGSTIVATAVDIVLDANGTGSVTVPASDATGLVKAGHRYLVTYDLGHAIPAPAPPFWVYLPAATPVVPLAKLLPTPGTAVTPVVMPAVTSVGGLTGAVTGAELAALPEVRAASVTAVKEEIPLVTYVGTRTTPVTDPNTARPAVGAGVVYWLCATGVRPANALDGDLVWTSGTGVYTVDNTLIDWWKTSRYGHFTTYTWGSSNYPQTIYPSGATAATITELGAAFSAQGFADDMRDFGCEYVIFAAWHFAMNALYPSAAMNAWRGPGHASDRDVIADLAAALKPHGIKLMLYIHLTDGHDFSTADQAATGWNDATNSYRKWNDFVNQVVAECGNRYGTDIAGFWVDMVFDAPWATKIDKNRIRASMLAGNPNRVLAGNGLVDATSLASVGGSVDYLTREYYQGAVTAPNWVSGRDHTALIVSNTNQWWATRKAGNGNAFIPTAADAMRFLVIQAATTTTGGGWSPSGGPFAGSGVRWEDGIAEGLRAVQALVAPIAKSVKGVLPSSAFPTRPGVSVTNVPGGWLATQSADRATDYIHVLNPPAGKVLTLPAAFDGRVFTSAKLLASGKTLALAAAGGGYTVTLAAEDSWSATDTVIALTGTGRRGTLQPVIVDDDNTAIVYDADWLISGDRNAGDNRNQIRYTQTVGRGATFTPPVPVTGLIVRCPMASNYGNMEVFIDGVSKGIVALNNGGAYRPQQNAYVISGLPRTAHTIRVVLSAGTVLPLDGFVYMP